MKRWIGKSTVFSIITFVLSLLLPCNVAADEPEGELSDGLDSQGGAADPGEGGAEEDDEAFLGGSDDAESGADEEGEDKGEEEAEEAEGEEAEGEEEKKGKGAEGERWDGRLRDHHKQGFVNINVGTGYFFVAPYEKNNPDKMCEQIESGDAGGDAGEGEPVCGGRSGFFLEFLGGYGLKPGFELLAIFRLGVEQPTKGGLLNQPKVRQFGVGLKFYNPDDGLIKLGVGVAPLFDFSNRGENVPRRFDLIIHVPILLQFDVFPWFGPYAQAGVNVSFISEFRFEITGAIGVQGRFP